MLWRHLELQQARCGDHRKAELAKAKRRKAWAGFDFQDAVISAVVAVALACSRTDTSLPGAPVISGFLSNPNFL